MRYIFHFLYTLPSIFFFFFFNDTATTEIYTLSLHDALPICRAQHADRSHEADLGDLRQRRGRGRLYRRSGLSRDVDLPDRSEEHTSELQSLRHLVCRLLL